MSKKNIITISRTYGSNGKGIIPTQKGDYLLTIEIPQSNRYYWGSTTVKFSIK